MGFDNECILNIQSLAGEYFCPVCRTLVYPHEALQTQCTHLYCKPCLTYVAGSTQACPYDGYLVTEAGSKPLMESNKALAETIGKTSVHCLYHRSGCVWQGPLSECTGHCSGCAFGNSPVVCNRCGIQIVHRQVQEHAQTCNVNGANSQLQGTEAAQDAGGGAISVDQSKITNQAAPPASQAQPVLPPHTVQNVSQTPPSNPLPQVPPATSAPAPDQWYQQQQQQQYYQQQYPGYDPYQQQQAYQQYYPYQQQPPTQTQSQPQIQAPIQPQPQIQPQGPPQFQPQVPSSIQPQTSQNQGQVNAQPQQQLYQPHMPPQSYPQVQPQAQMQVPQYQQPQMHPQSQPHFQPPPQHPPVAAHPSYPPQPHQPPMQHAPPPPMPTQYPQPPPPTHMRPTQPPPHMLPPSQAPPIPPHSQPGLPPHPRPQQPPPQQYMQPFPGQAQGQPMQQQAPLGYAQPQQPHGMPPPQNYMGRPPMPQSQQQQFSQPQSSGIMPAHPRPPPPQFDPNQSQPQSNVNMTNQPPNVYQNQEPNQYTPPPPPLGGASVDRKEQQEDKSPFLNKSESVGNEFRSNFNQVKPESGIIDEQKTEDNKRKDEKDTTTASEVQGDSGTSTQRVKEEMKEEDGTMKQEADNGSSIHHHERTPPQATEQSAPVTEQQGRSPYQQRPLSAHLRPPGHGDHFQPPHPDFGPNNNRGYRRSEGEPLPPPLPSHFDTRRPDLDRGPYGHNSMRMNGDEKYRTPDNTFPMGSPKYGSHSHSSRPFSGYPMDGPPSRFLDKDPYGFDGGPPSQFLPPYRRPLHDDPHTMRRFDDNHRPDFHGPPFGHHRMDRGPHNFDLDGRRPFGERFGPPPGPPHMHRDGPGKPPFGPGFNSFQDYGPPPHKPPPFKSDRPHMGEPGFRSSYSRKGFQGFFAGGGPESFDGVRKRKAYGNSEGWCRICKIDCETVEGLDMHGQTREHQRKAMDMVLTIKQNNAKKHKGSNDHSAREEPGKLRNTERVNAS